MLASETLEHPAILDFIAHKEGGYIVAMQPIKWDLNMCLAHYDGHMYSNAEDVAILYSDALFKHIVNSI